MWVLSAGTGCLDRDLFQQERQGAMVRRPLFLALDEILAVVGVAVLALAAHGPTTGAVHQH